MGLSIRRAFFVLSSGQKAHGSRLVFEPPYEGNRPVVLRDLLRVWLLRFIANRLVTPFTPYVLSDAFLASEVEKYGLRGLNARSINLANSSDLPARECPIIFVQVNQLDVFAEQILPRIAGSFTLITGKWHLPGLELNDAVDVILANPHLKRWYSQNQIYQNIPIDPFPYGVKLSSAPHVYWRMRLRAILGLGRSGVFVPHVASHPHLDGPALDARSELANVMAPRLTLGRYLNRILRHRYVVSPPGDRMDTYRHWESVALGAIPISNLPAQFSALFGEGMLARESLLGVKEQGFSSNECVPKPELATVRYWRGRVSEVCRDL